MAITKITSRDFNQNKTSAKKAAGRGPVLITERGKPTHVLLTYAEYEKMSGSGKSIADLLAMPETADVDIDFPRLKDFPRDVDLS